MRNIIFSKKLIMFPENVSHETSGVPAARREESCGKQNGKFRSSLFKGLQVEGSALVALRRARNTLA